MLFFVANFCLCYFICFSQLCILTTSTASTTLTILAPLTTLKNLSGWEMDHCLSSIARLDDLNVVALADDYNNSVQVDKLNFGQNFEADYFPKKVHSRKGRFMTWFASPPNLWQVWELSQTSWFKFPFQSPTRECPTQILKSHTVLNLLLRL